MSYYKVVLLGYRRRLISNVSVGKSKVTYKIGEWVSAHQWLASQGYHLFVFKSLERAKDFQRFENDLVYKCLVRGVCKELPKPLLLFPLSSGQFEEEEGGVFPPGTKMVKQVKLTELVPWVNYRNRTKGGEKMNEVKKKSNRRDEIPCQSDKLIELGTFESGGRWYVLETYERNNGEVYSHVQSCDKYGREDGKESIKWIR